MNTKKALLVALLIVSASFTAALLAVRVSNAPAEPQNVGSGVSPETARLATTSTIGVGPSEVKSLFDEKSFCASRVISTKSQAIMLGFDFTPTLMSGFLQAASTTVVYPASQFGCTAVSAFGAVGSTTINLAEYLW